MNEVYPSNSPSILVFKNNHSKITVDGQLTDGMVDETGTGIERYQIGSEEEFNVLSGFNGLTIEDPAANGTGEVTSAIITIPFKRHKVVPPTVTLVGMYKLHMGDNTQINATNPVVVDTTISSVSIKFTMTNPYPSNSPCMLVFVNNESVINVSGNDDVDTITPPDPPTPDPGNPPTPGDIPVFGIVTGKQIGRAHV